MNSLQRLYQGYQRKKEERVWLDRTIEEIIEIADPKIKRASHYQRTLREPVMEAVSYYSDLIGKIPGPIRLSGESYHSEPVIRALFTKSQDVEVLLNNSPDVDALRKSGYRGDAVGLLTVDKEEKTIFGHEKHGELIQRDVAQRTVNFTGHRIVAPCPELAQTRIGVVHRGLVVLATVAMEKITKLRSEISELRQKRDYLSGYINILNGRTKLHSYFAVPDPAIMEELEKVQGIRAEVEARLRTLLDNLSYPKDSLRYLKEIMQQPAASLTVGTASFHLNWSNVLVKETTEEESNTIILADMSLSDRLHRYGTFVVLPVR